MRNWIPRERRPGDRISHAARDQAPALNSSQSAWNLLGFICSVAVIAALVAVLIEGDDSVWLTLGVILLMTGCAIGTFRSLVVLRGGKKRLVRDVAPGQREVHHLRMSIRLSTTDAGRWRWSTVVLKDPVTHQDMFVSRSIREELEEVDDEPVTFHGRLRPGGTGVVEFESGGLLVLAEPLRVPLLSRHAWSEYRRRH